jgi:signal transduction histidine kinase
VLKLDPAGENTQTAETRAMLERQLGRMVRLVDDLLDVNRISLGKIELRKERVELAAVVHDAVEAAGPLCTDMKHELTLTLPPQPVYLNADPARLAQAVGNLLINACKFTARAGRIWLSVDVTDGRVSSRRPSSGCATPVSASPPTRFTASSSCSPRSICRWSVSMVVWVSAWRW